MVYTIDLGGYAGGGCVGGIYAPGERNDAELLWRWFKPIGSTVKVVFKVSDKGTLLVRDASDAELLAYRLGAERAYEAKREDLPKVLEAAS